MNFKTGVDLRTGRGDQKGYEIDYNSLKKLITATSDAVDTLKKTVAGLKTTASTTETTSTAPAAQSITFPLTVPQGGTGAVDAPSARQSLGALGAEWKQVIVTPASSPYQVTTENNLVFVDCTTGAVTVLFPDATLWTIPGNLSAFRHPFTLRRTDGTGNTCTMQAAGAQTVEDGAGAIASTGLLLPGEALRTTPNAATPATATGWNTI